MNPLILLTTLWVGGAAALEGPLGLDAPRPSTVTAAVIQSAQKLLEQDKALEAIALLDQEEKVNPGSSDVLLNLGWANWQGGRLEGARRAWSLLYACDPKSVLFVRLFAAIEVEAGDPAHGEALAREALRLAPGDRDSSIVLVKALIALQRIPEAQAVAEGLLARFPRHTGVLYVAAEVYDLQHEYNRSIVLYDRLVSIAPQDARFGRRRADALYELGRYEEAIAQWRVHIDRVPPDGFSMRGLARVYWNVQAYDPDWEHWTALEKRYPQDPSALVLVAAVEIERGLLDEGLRSAKRVMGLAPRDADGIVLEAKALILLGLPDEAHQVLEAYLRANPDELGARFQLAELLAQMGLYPEALAQFDDLLKRQPENAAYRRLRAGVLFNLGRREEALREWEALVARRPPDLLSLFSMAHALASIGDLDGAVRAAERLVALSSHSASGYILLAQLQLDRGALEEAERAAKTALRLAAGDRDATVALARAVAGLGRPEEGVALLQGLLPRHKNYPPVLYYLADILLGLDRAEEALPHLDRLVALQRRNSLYHRRRGQALYAIGRFEPALAEWRAIAKARPPDLAAARLLGEDAMLRREWAEAAGWFERVVSTPAASALDHERLASAYLSGGRASDAMRAIDESIRIDPERPSARMVRADALEAMGRYSEAAEIYARLEEKNKNSERAPLAIARIEQARGNFDAALDRLRRARERFGWPQLEVREARVLADAGREKEAFKLARKLARGRVGGITVLAYPGLSRFERGDGVPVETLRKHLAALKQAGYAPWTVADLLEAATKGRGLPRKAVVLTIDASRPAALKAADAALKETGWKATLFASAGLKQPGQPSVEQLRELRATGRWDVQSFGLRAPEMVPIDSSTHTGRFLTARMWLKDGKRLETKGEYEQRVVDEFRQAREQHRAAFSDAAAAAFAFPGGDFGQEEENADPSAAPLNSSAVARQFDLGFAQDSWGFNEKVKRGAILRRFEVPREWSGERLASYLSFNDPTLQARMLEGNLFLAQGKEFQALKVYEGLERDGVSAAELYAQKGVALERIGYMYGAYQHYVRAYKLDPESERYRDLMRNAAMAIGPHVTPSVNGFSDSADRSHVKSLVKMGTSLEAVQVEGWGGMSRFRETRVPNVDAREMGLRARVPFNLWSGAEVSFGRRDYHLLGTAMDANGIAHQAGRLRQSDTFSGTLQGTLVPGWRSELGFDVDDVDSASAIIAGRRIQRLRAGLDWDMGYDWGATLGLERRRYTDGNVEKAGRLALMRRLSSNLSVGYALNHSDARFRSSEYYSPRSLNQHMLAVTARAGTKTVRGMLQAGAGYGFQDTGTRFVQSLRAGATGLLRQRFLWSVDFGYSRAPTYVSRDMNASLSIGF